MFPKSRKAQGASPSGTAAATLVAIIAALIILYVLALPPEERASILDSNGAASSSTGENGAIEDYVLLKESPGRIFPESINEFEKDFSPVSLYIGEEAIELKRKDSLYVRRALFSTKTQIMNFEVSDVEDVKQILLSFDVSRAKGRLMIKLNGEEIYEKEIEKLNVDPINLEKTEYLKDGLNEIEFSVSSPGVVFWATNEYELNNILITATSLKRETQTGNQKFVVTSEEKKNLKSLRLWYNTECEQNEVGKLDIWLNGYSLFSAVPDCGQASKPIEFLPTKLVTGENEIKFQTSKGRVLLDHLRITSSLKETKVKTFYFELDKKYFRGDEEDELNYEYYCDQDGERIRLSYKGNDEMTGWRCDDEETCEDNSKRYRSEQSEGEVTGALCEDSELEEGDVRYYCDDDDESIIITLNGENENTGWACSAGEICEGNFRRYDEERSKSTVLSALCEEIGYGDRTLHSRLDVKLYLRFEDEYSRKTGQIRVNNHVIDVDQTGIEFETNIKNYVEEGTNAIKIVPDEILDITELRVELEE